MSNTIFSGTSRYSNDFQAVIDRAVAIASLPMRSLQAEKGTLQDQSKALTSLDTKFAALQTAITTLETGLGLNSYTTGVSDGTIVSAAVSTGVVEGQYSIEVTNVGAYTNGMSANALTLVTDPNVQNIRTGPNFTLVVNDGTAHTATVNATTLNGLVTAINASGLGVQASAVNVGSSGTPDYRLSLQATKLGAVTISLKEQGQVPELMNTLATGALASYKVNGLATAATSDSRTVTLAPGLTVNLLKQSAAGVATTVSVTRGSGGVSSALSGLATAYNAAVSELDLHRGQNKGALSGQFLIRSLSDSLHQITGYTASSGTFTSLTSLGLTFDNKGMLQFDSTAFNTATTGKMTDLATFLGSSTGSGFLKSATDTLNGIEATDTGSVKAASALLTKQLTSEDDLIAAQQDRVDKLKESLQAQMAAADAMIASLEQQVNYFNGVFESMRIAAQSFK